MSVKSNLHKHRRAIYDPDRKGILIPEQQLQNTGFAPGDRFSACRIQRELFALVIEKTPDGVIAYEKYGIFIGRTRHIDSLLGGIYMEFSVELDPDRPRLTLRPIDHGIHSLAGHHDPA